MGKVKRMLEDDMIHNPENHNNPDPTEEEYEDIQGLFDDFLDKHIVVARMPTDEDKDEIESIIIDNKKDTL